MFIIGHFAHLNKYNNSHTMSKQITQSSIYTALVPVAWWSIRLNDFNKALQSNFKSLVICRCAFIIIVRLSVYNRQLKTRFVKVYGFRNTIVNRAIDELMRLGYITTVPHKTKTNIPFYVTHSAYRITALGKQQISVLAELIDNLTYKADKSHNTDL